MKKIIVLLLCAFFVLVFFAACEKEDASAPKESDPTTIVEPADPGNQKPADLCNHEWTLSAFVTEETEVPFAGKFICEKCENEEIRSISYTDIEIPLISLIGDVSPFRSEWGDFNKDVKVPANFLYESSDMSLKCAATLKLQGKSTASEDKYNFSVNLLDSETGDKKKVVFQEEWGKGYKYVLKSNYCDPSAVRNISVACLYGQMAHELDIQDHYSNLVNCGAVDGYPVLVYLNGKYQGLYNWVIRKDKWLYGMGDDAAGEAVLAGSDMSALKSDEGIVILPEELRSSKSWKEEYVNESYGDEGWAEESFNEMLSKIKSANAEQIRAIIAEYIEVERTLDVMLLNSVFGTTDNVCGNQVWCTFDGKKWAPVVYDHDRALGRSGHSFIDPLENILELIEQNILYDIIMNAYLAEIAGRYIALRQSVFTVENVMSIIHEKQSGLDERYFKAELEKWPKASWLDYDESYLITGFDVELQIIENYLEERFVCCDAFFSSIAMG